MPVKSRQAGAHPATTQRFSPTGKGDPKSDQLRKLSKKLGNMQVQAVIGANNQQRDAIYQFIVARLQRVRSAQSKEIAAMQHHRVWFDEVARKKSGFSLPDPTRWRTVARHYRLAAQSVARGNIGQAVQHLERAMQAEKTAFTHLPVQVALDHTFANDTPSPTAGVHAGDGCTPREVTEAVQLAEQIERVAAVSEPEGLPRMRKPWWGPEEATEDDDDAQKKNGKKSETTSQSKQATDAPTRQETQQVQPEEKAELEAEVQDSEHAELQVAQQTPMPQTPTREKKPRSKPPA